MTEIDPDKWYRADPAQELKSTVIDRWQPRSDGVHKWYIKCRQPALGKELKTAVTEDLMEVDKHGRRIG